MPKTSSDYLWSVNEQIVSKQTISDQENDKHACNTRLEISLHFQKLVKSSYANSQDFGLISQFVCLSYLCYYLTVVLLLFFDQLCDYYRIKLNILLLSCFLINIQIAFFLL